MDEIVTTNLAEFGNREKRLAGELLTAMAEQGLPVDFNDDQVTVAFNYQSGFVFLTNSDYQSAMLHDGKLETFYICPICGAEGFVNEVQDIDNHSEDSEDECTDWIQEVTGELNV
jgi:hypothetical protein